MPPESPSFADKQADEHASFADRLSPYNSQRVNEAVTRCVLKSETIGVFLCSADGTIREANDTFLRLVQATQEEVAAGKLTWQHLTPPEFLPRDYQLGKQIVTRGSCPPIEKQYLRKDGSRVDVIVLASRVFESPEFHVITLVIDASAQKQAGLLADTNLFLDTLLEHIPGLIFVKDAKNLRYIRLNKATEAYLDRPSADILNKTDEEIFGDAEASLFVAHDREMLRLGKTFDAYDAPLRLTGRETRVFHSKKIIIRDAAGTPEYILGIAEDVTEKRAAENERLALIREQAAREEAEKVAARLKILSEVSARVSTSLDYHTTLENLAEAVVPTLADWCTVDMYSTSGGRETFVTRHSEAVTEVFSELKTLLAAEGKDEERHAMGIVHTGAHFDPHITEESICAYTQHPQKRDVLRRAGLHSYISVPLHLRGAILGVLTLVTTRDSGRRFDANDFQLAQELARHAALAVDNARLYQTSQNLHRSKDEFLAMLSHELRTPLSVIHGYAEILRTDGPYLTEAEREEAYEIIHRNSEHQTQIVTDLLDVSALVTGKLSYHPVAISPAKAVASVVQTVQPSAAAKDIRLTLRAEDTPKTIAADPTRFQQIAWNLLSNAVKFTPRGGTVTVTVGARGNAFVMEVTDSGIGIEPAFLPHVFDRFRQEDGSATRPYGGLGLGLAIVRHLVEMHGGEIKATSAGKGRGATFTVTLPFKTD